MNLNADACECLDWFSRRHAIHRSTVPLKWRRLVRAMLADRTWLEPIDVVLVQITPVGRLIASAFRHGRAATAPGQREMVV